MLPCNPNVMWYKLLEISDLWESSAGEQVLKYWGEWRIFFPEC